MFVLVMEMSGSGAPQLRVPGPAEFSAVFSADFRRFRPGTIAAQPARMSLQAIKLVFTKRGTRRAGV
jgi:hypothetical protein